MINLQARVSQIMLSNPELAEPLFDVLVFMGMPKAALSPEYDESLEICYAKTADSVKHREFYQKTRAA